MSLVNTFEKKLKSTGLAQALARRLRDRTFRGSEIYWENRYAAGGNSGGGSYGELAKYKANVLNRFVRDKGIDSVLEFGCGDGAQLALAEYPKYIGLDVSRTILRTCIDRFADDNTKSFFLYDHTCFHDPLRLVSADLTLSLDVIFHLVEDEVFHAHMAHLFGAARRYVVIYASDYDGDAGVPHVRHRQFSAWVSNNAPDWRCIEELENPFAGQDSRFESFAHFKIYERISDVQGKFEH